jgi:hypothetical protein
MFSATPPGYPDVAMTATSKGGLSPVQRAADRLDVARSAARLLRSALADLDREEPWYLAQYGAEAVAGERRRLRANLRRAQAGLRRTEAAYARVSAAST